MSNNINANIGLPGNDDDDEYSFVEETDPEEEAHQPALKLTVSPKHEVIGVNADVRMTQVCATIKASELPQDISKRAPVDIIVALDVSGSMTGEKLKLCKQTLGLLIRMLQPRDRFGLVSFASEAIVEIPLRCLLSSSVESDHEQMTKEDALNKVQSLQTRGCTNISAAIGLSIQELQEVESSNEVRSIFLLTDGLANTGISHTAGIVDITRQCLVASSSIVAGRKDDEGTHRHTQQPHIHCFGYGSDHDDVLLSQIAEATTGGSYYFVENDSDVSTAFGDALGGVLSVVAQNAVLRIAVPPEAVAAGIEILDIHHDQKLKRDEQGYTYTVTIGDFYAEEKRDVIFDIKLVSSIVCDTPFPHASISLSYTDAIQKKLTKTEVLSCKIARPNSDEISDANQYVVLQCFRVEGAQQIGKADVLSCKGDLAGAREGIKTWQATFKCAPDIPEEDPLVAQLNTDMDTILVGLASDASYRSFGKKHCKAKKITHSRQRSAETMPTTPNVYRTPNKSSTANYFTL